MTITREQRLLLYNQCLILARLYPGESKTYEQRAQILSNGFTRLYSSELCNSIDANEVSFEVCDQVTDTLDLCRAIRDFGYEFEGFDGNKETDHFAYASFLIEELGRYQESAGAEMNSHYPMLPKYRAMLAVWKSCSSRFRLSADDAEGIIAAGERLYSNGRGNPDVERSQF